SQYARLERWIMRAGRLHLPCAALVLAPGRGVGKTMFACALAQALGGRGEPASLKELLTKGWNDHLTRQPVILDDEARGLKLRRATDYVRSLLTRAAHDLEGKHKPLVTLHGHVRLVITTNEIDALRVPDHLSEDGRAALAERLAYLEVQRDAVHELFASMTPEQHAALPHMLAQHLAYLIREGEDHYSDAELCEPEHERLGGWSSDLIDSVILQGGPMQALVELLARHVAPKRFEGMGMNLVVNQMYPELLHFDPEDPEHLYVSAAAVPRAWSATNLPDPPGTTTAAGLMLRTLSCDHKATRKRFAHADNPLRVWRVRWTDLLRLAGDDLLDPDLTLPELWNARKSAD
ncbi:MAG: hypothetical protein KC492_44630, partial [Myxococcales bacterium]|nr:hypothetical protein [Myxococcales bacterium]